LSEEKIGESGSRSGRIWWQSISPFLLRSWLQRSGPEEKVRSWKEKRERKTKTVTRRMGGESILKRSSGRRSWGTRWTNQKAKSGLEIPKRWRSGAGSIRRECSGTRW